MTKKNRKNRKDPYGGDDLLRWFNEVYAPSFPNETAMVADLDQQLARYREEHPEGQDHD